MSNSKKEAIARANVKSENARIAQEIKDKRNKQQQDSDVVHIEQLIEDYTNRNTLILSHISGIKSEREKNIECIKEIMMHPMFRSQYRYFDTQQATLLWAIDMAEDLAKYMQERITQMRNMLNAIKEQ